MQIPNVRIATQNDFSRCYSLLHRFHEDSPYAVVRFDPSKAAAELRHFLQNNVDRVALLCGDTGILTGSVVSLPYSSERIAMESMWYDADHNRKNLISLHKAFEYWARNVAKVTVIMAASFTNQKWFQNRGYDTTETMHIARL